MKIDNADSKTISVSEHHKQLFLNYHSKSKTPELVMQWSSRRVNGPPRELVIFKLLLIAVACGFLALTAFLFGAEEHLEFIICIGLMETFICSILIIGRELKTIYRYKIFKTHARLAYCLDIPKQIGTLLKGFAIFGIVCIFLIGLMSGSILVLAGPCGIAIFAALRLLDMKIPKKRDWSPPWDEHYFVTVDRKRRFIVTHVSDQTLGFEARLPNDDLFEQYLAFLHSVLPASAQFIEKKWNLSLI